MPTPSQNPTPHPFSRLRTWMEGTISSREAFYVPRQEDRDLAEAVAAKRWIEIHGPRLMGKSSLVRHLEFTSQNANDVTRGRTLLIHIEDARSTLNSREGTFAWCLSLADEIEVRLQELLPDTSMTELCLVSSIENAASSGPATWLHRLSVALNQFRPDDRFVIILDEVDRLFEGSDGSHLGSPELGSELADAFRTLLNIRPEGVSFAFVGLRRFSDLVQTHTSAAIGLGASIRLRDFTEEDWLSELSKEVGPEMDQELASGLWILAGGQPRLSIELISICIKQDYRSVHELPLLQERWLSTQRHDTNSSHLVNNIRRFWNSELDRRGRHLETKLSFYEHLLTTAQWESNTSPDTANYLIDTGLVRHCERGREPKLEIKAPLLREVFDHNWIQTLVGRLPKSIRTNRFTKKILIINTGGSIGMFFDEQRNIVEATPAEFRKQYAQIFEDFEADFIEPFSLDSINVHPQNWANLAREIFLRRNDYDAYVIAHGTDTLAYTSSGVAFALGPYLDKPVVFTAAQTTIDVAHGDAFTNLYRACLAAQEDIPEVVISFGNHVFRACRAQKMDEKRFEAFESPAAPALAVVSERVELRPQYIRQPPDKKAGQDWELRADFSENVLIIQLSPGMSTAFFEHSLDVIDDNGKRLCEGVIIKTLGSGNIPTLTLDYAKFIRKAVELGIPVLVSSQYPWHPDTHERFAPGSAGAQAGATLVPTMTPAAAEAKFRWVLARLRNQSQKVITDKHAWVRSEMQKNLIEEIDS